MICHLGLLLLLRRILGRLKPHCFSVVRTPLFPIARTRGGGGGLGLTHTETRRDMWWTT